MSIWANNGNIVIAPDYLGYGESKNSFHPYNIYSQLIFSARDMYLAAQEFIKSKKIATNGKNLLGGWSEGAAAGMALAKAIQENRMNGIKYDKAALMAGAYSNYKLTTDILQNPSVEVGVLPIYIRTLLEYDKFGKYNRPISTFLKSPFDTDFQNNYFPDSAFDTKPEDVVQPSFIQGLINQTDPIAILLKADDLSDWAPTIPIHIVAGEFDEWVPNNQTIDAYNKIIAKGGNITMEIYPDGGHGNVEYIQDALDFFNLN